jgi:hypothetical protein
MSHLYYKNCEKHMNVVWNFFIVINWDLLLLNIKIRNTISKILVKISINETVNTLNLLKNQLTN